MKKLIKRILLILLAVLIAAQAPFIYRRYVIGRLAAKIDELNKVSKEKLPAVEGKFKEYKGIIHAHTNLGGHSTGSFDELITAANANDLDFVIMTEHWSDAYDTAALTLNDVYGKTLFIGGNEIDTADGDRFLMIPGSADAADLRKMPTEAVLEKLHAENRLALVTYPEKFKSWDSNFDGDEVFSLHTESKQLNPFTALGDMIWSFPAYPQLTLATHLRRPNANLQKFDEIAVKRPVSLFAGTDAHSNIGFHLFGDDAGNKLINLKIDPYATSFGIVRLHVLIEKEKPFERASLLEAVKAGRFFVGFDVLGDTTGFRFQLEAGGEDPVSMGAALVGTKYPHLSLNVPPMTSVERYDLGVPPSVSVKVYRNGELFPLDIVAAIYSKQSFEPGSYRVEVYRNDLGPPFDKMPWIISNPIYVR